MGPLATIAVAGRILARTKSKVMFALDDLFAVLALVFYWICIGISWWGVHSGGGGKPLTTIPLKVVIVSLKVLYVGIMFTVATITAAKLSVLFFYYRIFRVSHSFKIAWMTLLFATLAWFVATFLMAIFRCTPIHDAWNPFAKDPNCLNLQRAFSVTESINCVTDLAIVLLPVGMIRSLRLPTKMKVGLAFVFLVGGLVCVTSIIRMIYSYSSSASNDALLSAGLWVDIQLCAAVICACLPTYRPILPSSAFLSSLRNLYPSLLSRRSKGSLSPESSRRSKGYAKYNNISDGAVDHIALTDVKIGNRVENVLANAIKVDREFSSYETRAYTSY